MQDFTGTLATVAPTAAPAATASIIWPSPCGKPSIHPYLKTISPKCAWLEAKGRAGQGRWLNSAEFVGSKFQPNSVKVYYRDLKRSISSFASRGMPARAVRNFAPSFALFWASSSARRTSLPEKLASPGSVAWSSLGARLASESRRQAAVELASHFEELKEQTQVKMGALGNPADYPEDIRPLIDVSWEFPSVNVPDYLLRLAPQVFQEQGVRAAQRSNDALQIADAARWEALHQLVSHLAERLGETRLGTPA